MIATRFASLAKVPSDTRPSAAAENYPIKPHADFVTVIFLVGSGQSEDPSIIQEEWILTPASLAKKALSSHAFFLRFLDPDPTVVQAVVALGIEPIWSDAIRLLISLPVCSQ